MSSIAAKIREFKSRLPEGVELVAVSKFHPAELIKEAYDAGQRIFGESRVQELTAKVSQLPSDIKWHFIGHLQTNKVKHLIGLTSLIESADSEKIIRHINAESQKAGITTSILLQVHVAQEETKFGFFPDELLEYLATSPWQEMKNIRICGIMGMATNTDETQRIERDFKTLHDLFVKIKTEYTEELPAFKELSMGMSHDWPIATREGATLVRIGTSIFGEREYT